MALLSASEGLANAWIEALACGTPIVISDAGGAREVVDRAEAGRIVAREPLAIATAIRDLLSNPPSAESVRDTVRRFSWKRSEEHTSELQSLMRISYAVFCLKKKK